MIVSRFGTVAQMVYAEQQPLSFSQLVGELHSILTRLHGAQLMFERDCEDIAFFDILATRIALGWDDRPGKGYSACLTVSVGSLEDIPPIGTGEDCEEICSRMVERLHRRHPALAILWHQTEEQLTGDLLDRLVERLPPMVQLFPGQQHDCMEAGMTPPASAAVLALREGGRDEEPQGGMENDPILIEATPVVQPAPEPDPAAEAGLRRSLQGAEVFTLEGLARSAGATARFRAKDLAATVAPPAPANDRLSMLDPHVDDLSRLRAALYPAQARAAPAPLNTKMRLTAHAMNATLIIVWAPLGAAVMTYALLKGENMKFSSRLMVLAGLFGAVLNTPIGQQMAAMAGV
ncbi:MAG: hypothetical protein ACK4HF_00990 [Paracoccaceae bacterium]